MDGKSVNLVFRMEDPCNMRRHGLPGQELHGRHYTQQGNGRPQRGKTHAAKREALRQSCLLRSREDRGCIRSILVSAPGKPCAHAKSTGGKTKPICFAESLASSPVRFSWGRYCVKDRGARRAGSRACPRPPQLRCRTPCPGRHSLFSAPPQAASGAAPSCEGPPRQTLRQFSCSRPGWTLPCFERSPLALCPVRVPPDSHTRNPLASGISDTGPR